MTAIGHFLPWGALMRLGLGVLRLGAEEFWAMTPRELAAAAGLIGAPMSMGRGDLAALMTQYPDAACPA